MSKVQQSVQQSSVLQSALNDMNQAKNGSMASFANLGKMGGDLFSKGTDKIKEGKKEKQGEAQASPVQAPSENQNSLPSSAASTTAAASFTL